MLLHFLSSLSCILLRKKVCSVRVSVPPRKAGGDYRHSPAFRPRAPPKVLSGGNGALFQPIVKRGRFYPEKFLHLFRPHQAVLLRFLSRHFDRRRCIRFPQCGDIQQQIIQKSALRLNLSYQILFLRHVFVPPCNRSKYTENIFTENCYSQMSLFLMTPALNKSTKISATQAGVRPHWSVKSLN